MKLSEKMVRQTFLSLANFTYAEAGIEPPPSFARHYHDLVARGVPELSAQAEADKVIIKTAMISGGKAGMKYMVFIGGDPGVQDIDLDKSEAQNNR